MGAHKAKLLSSAVLSLCLITVLAGCGGTLKPAPTSSEPAPESSPSTPTDPEPDPNADVLFTITANVRAVDGRTIAISMAAHAPLASTDAAAADLRTEFLGVCGAGNGAQPITEEYLADNGSTLMRVDLASSEPGLTFAAPIDLFFGSPYFAQSATGDGITPEPGGQPCFYGFAWANSGEARGIADFENADGAPDPNQWHFGHYGFAVDPASGTTIEACKVTITEVGLKSGVMDVDGWDPSLAATGISCGIGYSGE
ncbi:hypothetical protein GCM10022239_07280 [Leifsonia bigeumensis]|uniref:Uncharacterized protein n=1 Tax=Leifsonella bigeumensis TaxID=433643 RepID=A0ABP7F8F4_9MICO